MWTVCPRLQLSHTLGVESGEHRVLRENSDQQQHKSTHEISELLQAFLNLAPLPTIVSVCDCCSSAAAAGSWLIDR